MFKAFTDNISSFMSTAGGKKNASQDEASNKSEHGEHDEDQASARDVGDEKFTSKAFSASGDTSTDTKQSESKSAPPPRPAPPLTPASSVCKPDTPPSTPEKSAAGSAAEDDQALATDDNLKAEDSETKLDKIDEKLDEMASKAKEWGSYLFSVTKMAGASVSAKAKELKKVVEEKTILGDFAREQDKFVNENKEKARASEAAVPPWVGYNEEEQMKSQMLNLSNDKRNFLRNPPSGVQFHFDYETCYPVAMATLAEDEKLQKMRFELVPKLVAEPDFWRNYFYRVSLIKQSTQLTSLAKQTGSTESETEKIQSPSHINTSAKASAANATEGQVDDSSKGEDQPIDETSQAAEEFVSDAYNLEITDDDLMKEMQALRASPSAEDFDWEKELQKELTDYEVVGDANAVDDDALEREILSEIEASGDLK